VYHARGKTGDATIAAARDISMRRIAFQTHPSSVRELTGGIFTRRSGSGVTRVGDTTRSFRLLP
jgi:hypothetical protein